VQNRTLAIALLGGFAVARDDEVVPPEAWRLRKGADLVRLLALAPGHRLLREQVMDALWPDKEPGAASNNLYQALRLSVFAKRRWDPTNAFHLNQNIAPAAGDR